VLEQVVRQEFFVAPDNALALTAPWKGPRVENQDNFIILPFDSKLLSEALSSDGEIIFDLRVYPVSVEKSVSPVNLGPNQVVALYDYDGATNRELSFVAGMIIDVIGKYNQDWWKGSVDGGKSGFFPANYVSGLEHIKLMESPKDDENIEGDWQDREYFESYANLNIHLEMLSDVSRTTTYQSAIQNVENIKDKIVLDIGCGSGILSAFCAKAGAKHVYAVDASDVISEAQKVIKDNGLEDRVTFFKGKIEDIKLPSKVDVIVSEWMGTMLICESMISSVLNARLSVLNPGGLMLPSTSDIFLVPLCLDEFYKKKIQFWDDVYGVKMSSLKAKAHKEFFSNPIFDRIIQKEELIAEPSRVFHIDMHEDLASVLECIVSPFTFTTKRKGVIHGFGTWFDSGFKSSSDEKEDSIVLSTSPFHTPTHWKNVSFVLEEQALLDEGETIQGTFTVKRHKQWLRHFEVTLEYEILSKGLKVSQTFSLWR